MSAQQNVIKKFMAVLDLTNLSGVKALNEAIKVCTNLKFTTIQSVINKMVSDCRATNDAEKFLQDYCGIDLNNEDTGAITGADAGGSTVKTAESILTEEGNLQIYTKNSFKTRGGTFKLGQSYSSLTESEKFIWHALYTWWVPNALDLIEESYGSNYNLQDNVMTVYFKKLDPSLHASAGRAELNINKARYSNIDVYDENGSRTMHLGRLISHELTHSVMSKNISSGISGMVQFIKEGMAELTHGIDDKRKPTILAIAGNADSLKSALNVNKSSNGGTAAYAGGYMFLRYLAKQFASSNDFTKGKDYYVSSDSNKTLKALGGNDFIFNFGNKVKIYGGAGKDSIYSYGENITISGGKGDDIVSLSSYAENNLIRYAKGDGNDTIYGFDSNDTLHITQGDYTLNNKDNHLIIAVGKQEITLEYVYGEQIHIEDSKGNLTTYDSTSGDDYLLNEEDGVTILSGKGNDSIENLGSKVKIYSGAGDDFIKNNYCDNVKIYGDAGNDKIYNDSSDNATINGGAGKDSIENSYSSNVIISGGAGNDDIWSYCDNCKNIKIYGGTGDDILTYTGNITVDEIGTDAYSTSYSESIIDGGVGNDGIYNCGSSVTISGGKGNDTIENYGDIATINGGVGNDLIYSPGDKVTISGGKGNDSISFDSTYAEDNLIQYASGDGNDTVTGFNEYDTLHITKGSYSAKASGNDVIVTVGKGKILLKDAAGQKISIKNSSGKVTTKTYGSSSSNVSELFAENNFATADNLDSIVKNGSTATDYKFESKNFETLTQENNFLTYSDK